MPIINIKKRLFCNKRYKVTIEKFGIVLNEKRIMFLLVFMIFTGLMISLRPTLNVTKSEQIGNNTVNPLDINILKPRPSIGFMAPLVTDTIPEKGKSYLICFLDFNFEPSIVQLEEIDKAKKILEEFGYQVVLIALNETPNTIDKFIKSKNYEMYFLPDEKGDIFQKYNIISVPTIFLINKTGLIRNMRVGIIKFDDFLRLL